MTIGQMRQMVMFEAGIADVDAMFGWFNLALAEVLDSYTSLVKYDKLMVPDYPLVLTANQQTVPLPSDLQHIDLDAVRYRRSGTDANYDLTLFNNRNFLGDNNQTLAQFIRGDGQLILWPYANIIAGDELLINYWKVGSHFLQGVTVIDNITFYPDVLYNAVKNELVGRANISGDGKKAALYQQIADRMYSRSLGSTNLGSVNG